MPKKAKAKSEEMYSCLRCRKDVKIDLNKAKWVQCPYCGYRIIEKARPKVVKNIKVK